MTPTEAKDWLFGYGLRAFMNTYGWTEGKTRPIIAKWMHRYGSQLTAQALDHIICKRPMEPVSRAEAWFKAVRARQAEKHRPGFRPPANLPPQVPLDERVDPRRFAKLREFLESQ